MKRLNRSQGNFSYAFDHSRPPTLFVDEGEVFEVETEDNFCGLITSEHDLPTDDNLAALTGSEPAKGNPLSGPIHVKGAKKGDLLRVEIMQIVPQEKGFWCVVSGGGFFADSKKWQALALPRTELIRIDVGRDSTTRNGKCIYGDRYSWDLAPFVGTIGVAPEFEVLSSVLGQGPAYGNWDCCDISEGSALYLNCYHDGGLLYLGDVHASQGDGELGGTANEVKASVTLRCSVVKGKKIPYARIEKSDSIVSIYSARPLEAAIKRAVSNLVEWVETDYGMDPRDTYLLISTSPKFKLRVYQMCNLDGLQYTVGAVFPKEYLQKG